MSDTSNATALGIGEDAVIWVVGTSVEETTLLDPLPDGAAVVDEPQDRMDAVVLFVDTLEELTQSLDEVLPQVGSTPLAWISYPGGDRSAGLDEPTIGGLVGEYGWELDGSATLDETWQAVRLTQA